LPTIIYRMIIYNVTIKLSNSIASEWLPWMKHEHIPQVMATGCFTAHRLVRLLDVDDDEGPTYAAQYFATTREMVDKYLDHYAARLRNESFVKWGDQFIAFRSLMEVVD
jgi:hypothetical protein